MSDAPTQNENTAPTEGDDEPRVNQLVRRGFDGSVSMAHENAATQSLIAKATAIEQARWLMAYKCPRDMNMVRTNLKRECERPTLAKLAVYKVPRGGNTITGLSIRFAEVAMRCMGNMNSEAQTLYDSDEERVVKVTATDYETNSSWSRDITIKKTVERKRLGQGQRPIRVRANSFGDTIYIVEATPDDVNMLEAAAISKASRTAILRLIPGYLQDEMRKLCEKIATDAAAKDPDAERNAMVDAFSGIGVQPDQLAEYLAHPIAQASPAELVELRFLFSAIRGGEIDWSTILEDTVKARAKFKAEAVKSIAEQKAAAGKDSAAGKPPIDASSTESKPVAAAATTQPKADDKKASGGKGAQAAKDKIANAAKSDPKAEPKTTAEPSPDIKPAPKAEAPKEHAAPAPGPKEDDPTDVLMPPAGQEERPCAGTNCKALIDVPTDAPPGQLCYVCRQA